MSDTSSFDISDKRRLELTLSVREQIITQLTEKGLPDEKEDRQFLMTALDGMDRTVLSKARIKADENANQTQQQTTQLIAGLLSKVSANAGVQIISEQTRRELPELDRDITVTDSIEGETNVGVSEENYQTFNNKFETE